MNKQGRLRTADTLLKKTFLFTCRIYRLLGSYVELGEKNEKNCSIMQADFIATVPIYCNGHVLVQPFNIYSYPQLSLIRFFFSNQPFLVQKRRFV